MQTLPFYIKNLDIYRSRLLRGFGTNSQDTKGNSIIFSVSLAFSERANLCPLLYPLTL